MTGADSIKIFAQDIGNEFKSSAVTLEKAKTKLVLTGTVATDKSYFCAYSADWNGETDITIACSPLS